MVKKFFKRLGPGLITGAADDDPSGIGTYAIAGASLGLATLWTAFITLPFMAVVQQITARVGIVTGKGLGKLFRENFSSVIVVPAISLLFIANTINLGADLGAMADAISIFVKIKLIWLILILSTFILILQIFETYRFIANTFKWLTIALFAYIVDVIILKPNFRSVLYATFIPALTFEKNYLTVIVAIFGTTISPYLFFWQSDEEVEEQKEAHKLSKTQPNLSEEIHDAMIDTNVGMTFSNIVMYFIILAAALTLNKNGIHIETAVDAAKALRPLAGNLAGILFAFGMIGAGLLAVPILSGSAAYALAEIIGWRIGLDEKWRQAKGFYGIIVVSTVIGVLLNLTPIKPFDALFWTAVINGIIAPPILVLLMLTARNKQIMGSRRIGLVQTILGWILTIVLSVSLLGLL